MSRPKFAEYAVRLLHRLAKASHQRMTTLGREILEAYHAAQQRVASAPRRAMTRGGRMGQKSQPAPSFSAGTSPRRVEHAA